VLICVLVINWLSIPLTARAIHQPGEADPSIVGDWRGLYFHKNIAGAVSAISVMVFAFFATDQRRRVDWLLALAAAAFLVMTHSKSSMGLLLPSLAAWFAYRFGWRSGLTRSIATAAVLLLVVFAATAIAVDWDAIVGLVSDPQEFTGRTAIWSAELAFVADHPWLGSGFGSFSDTGGISPLHNYVGGNWVEQISHGHNGYLQLLMETGVVGFALSFFALIVQPGWAFWRRDAIPLPFKAFLFAMFVFFVLHNLLESDFLQGDGPAWVAFLLMLASLRHARAVSDAKAIG
jgi:O-antigen ligase